MSCVLPTDFLSVVTSSIIIAQQQDPENGAGTIHRAYSDLKSFKCSHLCVRAGLGKIALYNFITWVDLCHYH